MNGYAMVWSRLQAGQKLDETAKGAVKTLTTAISGENQSPGLEISRIDDYTFEVKGHRLTLIAEYKRAVYKVRMGSDALVGLFEFRLVHGGEPAGEPVHTMWFDSQGRLAVSGQADDLVDFVLGNDADRHRDARNALVDQMAVVLDRLLPRINAEES